MSKAGGLVLILGGLAVAAYVMPSDDDRSGPEAAGRVDVAKTSRVDERPSQHMPSQDMAVPKPQPAFRPIPSATARAAEPVPAFSAPVVVTITQRSSEPAGAPTRAAAVPRDRDALTRELQKELKRVGCYEGELNGAWTPLTRRAMKAFTDRVNATLPVEEPDGVLFAMVQSQQDRVCGKPCPTGQGLGEDGRCLPNAILAKATKKASPPATVAQLLKANPPPAENPAPAITGWSTTTTAAARASPPAIAAAPVPPPAIALAPTEGRMALAGPIAETTPPPSVVASPSIIAPAPQANRPLPPRVAPSPSRNASWTRGPFGSGDNM